MAAALQLPTQRPVLGGGGISSGIMSNPSSGRAGVVKTGPKFQIPQPAAAAAPAPAPIAAGAAPMVPQAPAAPPIPQYALNEQADPELTAARMRVDKYHQDLEQGTGYAADVASGKAQDQIEADVTRAREAAAAQGIPFDEAGFRRDAERAKQGAIADEKINRETLRGNMLAALQGVTEAGSKNKLAKNTLELERQAKPVDQSLGRYGTQAGIYGSELGHAASIYSTTESTRVAAMNALNNFLSSMSFQF